MTVTDERERAILAASLLLALILGERVSPNPSQLRAHMFVGGFTAPWKRVPPLCRTVAFLPGLSKARLVFGIGVGLFRVRHGLHAGCTVRAENTYIRTNPPTLLQGERQGIDTVRIVGDLFDVGPLDRKTLPAVGALKVKWIDKVGHGASRMS
jgi:hypothetical protein